MNIRSKFTVIGSLAVLSTNPLALAEEVAVEPEIAVCWEIPVDFKEPVIVVCPGIDGEESVSIDPVIIEETGEETFVDGEISSEEESFTEEETFTGEETYTEEESISEEESYNEEENFEEEEVTDGEVVEVTEGGEEFNPEVVYGGEGFVVPLDWIKRGDGENVEVPGNPQIYYSMTNLGGPGVTTTAVLGPEASPVARQIGPDVKATAVERSEKAGVIEVNRQKKGPVALVKEGRVFLR